MAEPFQPERVEVLLFDLGGVLIDIDFGRCTASWARAAGCDADDLASRFCFDAAYEEHERGVLGFEGYAASVRETLGLALSDEEVLAGWNDIYVGLDRAAAALLELAGTRFPLYAFTNTNAAHQAVWSERFAEPLRLFTSTFVSSEIGLRKPDRAAFEHVAARIAAPPSSILFFDDTPENVTGAREAGMQAVHVTSSGSIATALAELGVRS